MESKIRYTLGKKDRLKSRKAIEQLFKEGRSFALFPFRLLYVLQQADPAIAASQPAASSARLQAGFSVSSRNFKKAVDRNRVKRLMRETYRQQKNELQLLPALNDHTLAIFFIYVGKELPGYELICEKMTLTLKRLIKLISENRG